MSGFNVYPAEVEAVLSEHPDVARVGVVGARHAATGETVHAHIVLREGAIADEQSIIDHAATFLARYKCPTRVYFEDSLPETFSGKVKRIELE